MKQKEVVVILGQTATGKSDLAVYLASRLGGEVISADSRQVYKGLDIGSGKITQDEMKGIPHHLLDVVNPKKVFSAEEYRELAISAIAEIRERGEIPIICGGTGFYIDAIFSQDNFPKVAPNKKLREKLAKKSPEELFNILKKLDKRRASNIDPQNKIRLIRAIEIAKAIGQVPLLTSQDPAGKYKAVKIGLYLPEEKLKERIHKRLESRIKSGMIKEAQNLHSKGLTYKRMNELGLEYRYLARHIRGKITKQELVENLDREIYRYAKRQMTWFKRDKTIKWFDASKFKQKQVLKLLKEKL